MISNNEKYFPYDLEYSHIVREIKTPISIYASPDSTESKSINSEAVWDTGATHSVISLSVANKLDLISIDKKIVGGIGQEVESDIVVATILLPNGTVLTDRRFLVNNIPGADVLIGMDIISIGDFNISNANGKTLFSFVIPPFKNKISYLKLAHQPEADMMAVTNL